MKIIGDGTRARLKEGDLWSDDPVRLLTAIESAEALLEGRTTRPTDAELVKVSEAGGFWRFRMEGKEYNSERDTVRLDSADFGCAQSRRRWFEVWVRGGCAVPRWTPPARAAGERRPLLDVLDAAASWSPTDAAARRARGLRPLAPNTLRQVAAGGERFGGGVFVVRYNGSQRARAVVYTPAAPLGALTTRDRFCLGRGVGPAAEIRTLTLREMARLFDLPESYGFAGASRPDAVTLAGNALVASVLEWLHLRISEVVG